MQTAQIIPLTHQRRTEHYWRRLVYLGPTQPARCKCGRGRSSWELRRGTATGPVLRYEDHTVTKYRCRCGRPVIKVDAGVTT